MCARFVVMDDKEIAEINSILKDISMKFDGRGLVAKTGEVYPTNNVAVLALADGKPTLGLMSWGYPKWDGKGVIVNARSETIMEKKMKICLMTLQRTHILVQKAICFRPLTPPSAKAPAALNQL